MYIKHLNQEQSSANLVAIELILYVIKKDFILILLFILTLFIQKDHLHFSKHSLLTNLLKILWILFAEIPMT